MKQIDERGNACPIPVVHTKKALESMDGETKLIVLVDNEPAVQNVTRFAEGKNCEVKSEKISDNEFKIEIMAENYTPADEEEEIVCAPSAKDDFIIAVSSNEMGQGEKALGQLASAGQLFQGQPLLDAELLDFMADIQIDASLSVCSNIKPQSYFY